MFSGGANYLLACTRYQLSMVRSLGYRQLVYDLMPKFYLKSNPRPCSLDFSILRPTYCTATKISIMPSLISLL